MPLPKATIIDLAKSYAYQIEHGKTPQQARQYLAESFPATLSEIRSAIRQAQRAMRVGEVLSTLTPQDTVRTALEGQRAPAPTVGVRVMVTSYYYQGQQTVAENWVTLYIEVPWDATLAEVQQRAADYTTQFTQYSDRLAYQEVSFVGPTLWPGHTPGT